MYKSTIKKAASLVMTIVMIITMLTVSPLKAAAATVDTGVAGLTADSSGNATWSYNNGTITGSVKASSSSGCSGTTYTSQSGTLILTNNTENRATLSMSIELSLNGGSITIDSEAVTARGTRSFVLDSGSSIVIELTSAESEAVTSISLDDISLIVETNVTVTFLPPSNGSYTVNGVPVTEETTISTLSTEQFTLNALAASGYKFFGWRSIREGTERYLSYSSTYVDTFVNDQTVEPVFVSQSLPVFEVGSMAFTDLNEAINYAVSARNSTITLISDGTLPSGNYAIPSGKTLLIPFDDAYTVVEATPEVIYGSHSNPSAYKTLTMADGASITVQDGGAVSVAGKLCSLGQYGGWNGCPTGPDGRIKMESGSSITVQGGGNLYCWGYIYGSGSVTAQSGATVYEAFQIKDWRGGTATRNVYSYAFIFNQYYIQNIEVPLTIEAGAEEKLYSSVNASSSAYPMGATLVGSSGLFNVTEGHIIKDYVEGTDRLNIEVHGKVQLAPMTLTGLPIIGSVNTANYILPITSNLTVDIQSGSVTVTQNIELLPSVEIKIAEEAEFIINNGKKVYLYDNDDWGNFTGIARLYVIGYSVANSTTVKRNANGLVDAKIDVNGTFTVKGSLYTSEGGANITSSHKTGKVLLSSAAPSSNVNIYEMAGNTSKTAVTFNPAKLHNGPDRPADQAEFTSTEGTAAEKGFHYCSTCDLWYDLDKSDDHDHLCEHVLTFNEAVEPTCTSAGHAAYWNCSECGKYFSDEDGRTVVAAETVVIPALGHDFGEWTVTTAPTCTETGEETRTCSRCDETETREVAARGHDLIHHVGQAATCTEIGWNAYDTCSRCDYTTYEELAALGHDLIHHEGQAATCTEIGWNAYDTCSRCDYTTYEELAALGHDLVHHDAKAATCTEIGWGAYDTCSRCDYTTYVEIPALDHDLEHHEAKAATCTEIGWGAYDTCSRCDYTTYVEIPALDHDLEHHEAKAATCTEIGWNAYDTCSRCDYTTYVEIPAHGHDYVAVVTDPTCTEAGFTTHTCSRCGDSYADTPVDAIGHEWDTEVIMWQWRGVTEATATFWCVHDGSHTVVLSAEITKADGIGDDAGYMVYTATVTMGIEVFSDVQKIQKHLVTFVDDDEETVLSEEQIVLHGETAMKPVDPTRKFYTFKGWYLGETLYDFASPVTSDIELRAGWDLVLSFSVTATMEDNFNLNFYIYNLADKDASDVTVYWVFDGKEYEQNLGQLNRYDNNRYRVVLTELFAFQMTFNISIQVKCEGKIVMTQDTFCLRDYFEYLTNNLEDDKMEEIARAALDYGTAAQQYFDGRTYDNGIPYDVNIDSLANQNTNPENTMPSVDKPDNSVSLANTVEGLSVKTASLIFGTETSIKVYFTYTGDISKLSISCDNGKVPTAVVLESDGRYSICIKKIRSYELYKDYTISFADDTGTAQLVYSPYAYAAYNWDSNTSGLSRLVRTLVAYGEIARLLWPNN